MALPKRHDPVPASGDLSPAEKLLCPQFHANRADHIDVSSHRITVAADGRALHTSPPEALLIVDWHGMHPDGPYHACLRARLWNSADSRRAGRLGLINLSSEILSRCTNGLRRSIWTRNKIINSARPIRQQLKCQRKNSMFFL